VSVDVGQTELPSPPAALVAGVDGDLVTLLWMPTYRGGAPAGTDVSVVSDALSGNAMVATGTHLQLAGVPPGEYWALVRSTNAAGYGDSSRAVQFSVPGVCRTPAVPERFVVFASPGRLGAVWDPSPEGGVPERYEVVASHLPGVVTPVGLQRVHEAPARSGVYGRRVRAVNGCGTSALTPQQTAVVP